MGFRFPSCCLLSGSAPISHNTVRKRWKISRGVQEALFNTGWVWGVVGFTYTLHFKHLEIWTIRSACWRTEGGGPQALQLLQHMNPIWSWSPPTTTCKNRALDRLVSPRSDLRTRVLVPAQPCPWPQGPEMSALLIAGS